MTNLKNKLKLSALFMPFILMGMISCSEREAYYQFQELKEANWDMNEVLFFEIDTLNVEHNIPYDVSIEITNNIDYQYQNLWLFSKYNANDSTTVKTEDEFILADEFGKWRGAGFSSLYQSSHIVMKAVLFEEKKEYKISVRHGMQDKVLHGIEKVGLKIKKSEK